MDMQFFFDYLQSTKLRHQMGIDLKYSQKYGIKFLLMSDYLVFLM